VSVSEGVSSVTVDGKELRDGYYPVSVNSFKDTSHLSSDISKVKTMLAKEKDPGKLKTLNALLNGFHQQLEAEKSHIIEIKAKVKGVDYEKYIKISKWDKKYLSVSTGGISADASHDASQNGRAVIAFVLLILSLMYFVFKPQIED
jgi:hypothetical protein